MEMVKGYNEIYSYVIPGLVLDVDMITTVDLCPGVDTSLFWVTMRSVEISDRAFMSHKM